MLKIFKIFLFTIGIVVLFLADTGASAQEQVANQTISAQEAIKLDEEVTAKNLEIKEPKILPINKFYFLKNWKRGIQSAFTFNPVKKAGLKLKYSSEKLLEVRKMAEQANNPAVLQKAVQEYQKEMEKIKTASLQIKEKASSDEDVGKFLDKFTKQQVLQEKILEKLEQQVPTSAVEKIKEVREQHLENFGEVMQKLDDNQGKIKERLENTFQNIQGSDFKELNNMQILKKIEEKAPEHIKEQIRETRENTLQNFKEKLETMPLPAQDKLQSYIQETTASVAIKMELAEDIKSGLTDKPEFKQKLEETREAILEQSQNEIKSAKYPLGMCPYNPQYQPGFCRDGRIIIVTNEEGLCPAAKCIRTGEKDIAIKPAKTVPGKDKLDKDNAAQPLSPVSEPLLTKTEEACVNLWDPVCGIDKKTYSNKCWINLAGQKIAYKGICEEQISDQGEGSAGAIEIPVSSGQVGGSAGAVEIPTTSPQPIVPSAGASEGNSSWQTDETQGSEFKTQTPKSSPPKSY